MKKQVFFLVFHCLFFLCFNIKASPTTNYVRSYNAVVKGNTITICVYVAPDVGDAWKGTSCNERNDLLRQNLNTGKVLRIQGHCSKPTKGNSSSISVPTNHCFVDECVPPGQYVYGFAKPLMCFHESELQKKKESYIVTYHTRNEIKVLQPLGSCKRSPQNLPPVAFNSKPPWKSDPIVCSWDPFPYGCGCQIETGKQNFPLEILLIFAFLIIFRSYHSRKTEKFHEAQSRSSR